MGYNIGPTISVKGETQFNAAMNAMKQNMKYLSAEASAAMSVFGKNEKSVESLTVKNAELNKAWAAQKQYMQEIKNAMSTLTAAGVEPTSEKFKELKANLDNVTAAANITEREIKENEQTMADLQRESSGLGDTVNGLATKFGVVLPDGAQKGISALNSVSASAVAFVGMAAKMISSLVKMSTQGAQAADEILVLSSTTGLSTKQVQEFQYASELVDVSMETLAGSMSKMVRSMSSARDGTGDAAEAYRKLRVNVTGADGQLRDSTTVFYEVIDKLGKIRNETERDAAAMAIFGKSAKDLNPLIEAGSEKLKEYTDAANEMGYVMSDEALAKLGRLDDAMQTFANQKEAVKNSLAMALLPLLTGFFEILSKIPPSIITVVAVIATVIVSIIAVIKAVESVKGVVGTLGKLFDAGNTKMSKTTLIIMGVVAALIALAVVIAVIIGKSKELNDSMASMGSQISGMQRTASTGVPRYASGTLSHPGGPARLVEFGPELVVPQGARVYSSADTKAMLSGGGGGDIYNITIPARDIREFNDIVRIAQNARITQRAGYAGRK